VALHGIQSHSGWYKWSSAQMANAGFNVYFADRRGSGLNGFRRGHADHGTRLLNDVRQLTRLARHENASTADLPLTLLGLSWGGRIAAAFAATYPRLIDRLVLLYPGITPRIRPTRWQNFQLQMARRHDVREKSIPIPLDDPSLFTSSKDWQNFILNDPLTLHRVTTGFLNSGRDLDHIIQTNSHHITHPALVMLAGNDQIIDNDATRQCVAAFQSPHVTTITYPNACHTLEFEPDRQRFADDLVKWLQDSQ
jgi:alpha-beta hydrolase superfamily lysophospholipase